MSKQGEIQYLNRIEPSAVRHAIAKPFSDALCGRYLVELGTVMALLPAPPARLLDLGCGTGWTSIFFAKHGYDVTGIDIAPDMIFHARRQRDRERLVNLQFAICDYEAMDFVAEFDCAVFFSSLHHAVDEALALAKTFEALKHDGICITCEPGFGHQQTRAAREAMSQYGVTEKDMPPAKIIALAKQVGFRRCRLLPHPLDCSLVLEGPSTGSAAAGKLRAFLHRLPLGARLLYAARWMRFVRELPHRSGIVVLEKGDASRKGIPCLS